MSTDWKQKLIALLRALPGETLNLGGQRQQAIALLSLVLRAAPGQARWERARHADQIASAADLVNFPEKQPSMPLSVDFLQKPVLCHPLAGRQLNLGSLQSADSSKTQEEAVKALCVSSDDDRKRFLRLWRGLIHELEKREEEIGLSQAQRLGKLWGVLPADARMPDHPLMQHLSITAAIAAALSKPTLLICSLGPVQGFIATARRTQDLWMGSYILSYLVWQGIKVIAGEFGPDAVVYPSLRGQPLTDLWLHDEEKVWGQRPTETQLRIATFPNKFVALLPADQAEQATMKVEHSVREAWQRLADKVQNELAKHARVGSDKTWTGLWQQQIPRLLEIYWCIYPWVGVDGTEPTGDPKQVITQYHTLFCPPQDKWDFKRFYDVYAKPADQGGGQYDPNVGTTYSLLYDLADRGFNARKGLRNFVHVEERGAKCTLCGQRQALCTQTKDERRFWTDLAVTLQQKKRYEVKPEGAERLCTVCAVKRFVQQEVFDSELGVKRGFPSTSTVAAATFCERLLTRLVEPNTDELWGAFQAFVRALQQAKDLLGKSIPETRMDVPRLTQLADQLPQGRQNIAQAFVQFDGDWLFDETYTERLERDYGLHFDETTLAGLRVALERLLWVMGERPVRYFTSLTMDGDYAGRWLSGTHVGLTTFGKVLHPDVEGDLAQRREWADLLNTRRLMTPAVHAAISGALANFALRLVRWVIEERYPGRLVYAGGDDVLALLPMECTLAVARELRALFSGEIAFDDPNLKPWEMDVQKRQWKPTFADPNCKGYLWFDGEPMLTMGPTATTSVGIAIAHHLSPLDATLNAMREAEKAAKSLYGRNALCVHLLKRSGEQVRVGAQWFYADGVSDTVELLEEVRQRFIKAMHDQPGLSMKFPYTVFDGARTLAGLKLPAQERLSAQKAELYRLIRRHKQGQWHPDEHEESRMVKNLAHRLMKLAQALHSHCPSEEPSPDEPQPGFVELAKWLLLIRFVVQGGE